MTGTLAGTTLEIVDRYWADFLGCDRAALRPARALALPHTGVGDYAGAFAVELGGAPIVSLPPALVAALGPRVAEWTQTTLRDAAAAVQAVRGAFDDLAHDIIGPAYLGYADAVTLRTPPMPRGTLVHPLGARDALAVEALRDACSRVEWEHGGSELALHPAAGAFVGDELTALSGYEVWGGRIAHIAVVSHPAFRGRGHARAAVAAVARHALDRGLVPQYRTLESNRPSRAIADSLGFIQLATSVAVRLGTGRRELGTGA